MSTVPHNEQSRRPRNLDKPLVFIERPRCPTCGSADLQTRRTTQNGDASLSRDTLCRECKLHFVVVVE